MVRAAFFNNNIDTCARVFHSPSRYGLNHAFSNVQGSCDMGSFPHELPGYRHVSRHEVRQIYESLCGVTLQAEPGLRIPNMFDSAIGGSFKGLYVQGEDIAQSDPNTTHVEAALRSMKLVCENATAMGYPMSYAAPSQIMDEIAATTPTFAGVLFDRLDAEGSTQWPVTQVAPHGTPTMHVGSFVRGLGQLTPTVYVPTTERANRRFPLVLTTGRILSQYNVGAQTRRTPNSTWHPEDVLEIHPSDAELRGVTSGDVVELSSRVGTTRLTAQVSDRMPAGVVYTTFHHPVTGANVVTTDNSDWATNCPEYKVTAVQVQVVTQAARAQAGAGAELRSDAGAPVPQPVAGRA